MPGGIANFTENRINIQQVSEKTEINRVSFNHDKWKAIHEGKIKSEGKKDDYKPKNCRLGVVNMCVARCSGDCHQRF